MSECRYVCGNIMIIMLQTWESMSMIIIINFLVVSSHPNQSSQFYGWNTMGKTIFLWLKRLKQYHVYQPWLKFFIKFIPTEKCWWLAAPVRFSMRLWHWELATGKSVTPPHLAWNLGWNVGLCLVIPLSHGIPWSVDAHEIGKRAQCVYYIWWRNG